MYIVRGLGAVTYDAQGMPVEDPANTTYGAQSGGTYPQAVDSGNVCDSTSKMFAPSICNTLYSGGSGSITSWLNTNSTSVMIAAAVGFGLLIFAKAGR